MKLRAFLFAATAAVLSLGTGCTASDDTSEDTEESVDELNGGLRNITIVKGSMSETGTLTVAYEPHAYAPTRYVPFLAVELNPAEEDERASDAEESTGTLRPMNGEAMPLTVNVAGDFPGSPRVLVTDENFRVLGSARGIPTERGDEATVVVTNRPGKKFVLVRDMLWVKPMTFDVTVGR